MVGQTISHYRVLEKLGEGGMGEVYRAEDIHLGRMVALKFLHAGQDRALLLREARTASTLNHPNVCQVYEVSPDHGLLAIEYVEGCTLKQMLDGRPLPVRQAVALGLQIGEGLSAAHAAGIVHRDIKPGNVMVTSKGQAKVMDFGLAKAVQPSGLSGDTTTSGTIGYMAPEQIAGQRADARADIWAFGAVLHEMLTGRLPVGQSETLPEGLGGVVRKALFADPGERYQHVEDLLVDLRRAGAPPAPKPAGRRGPWMAAASLAALALALAGWQLIWKGASAPSWKNATFSQLTDQAGQELYPSLSPDGKSFVYASRSSGNWDIYFQRVGGNTSINLTEDSLADDTQPAISPDGERIAFRSERGPPSESGGIFVMGATGESVKRLTDFGYNPAWSPDGTEIVCATAWFRRPQSRLGSLQSQLFRVSVSTGEKRLITPNRRDAVGPHWSPHGRRLAFWGLREGNRDIWTIPASGGEPVAVTNDAHIDWNPIWSPDGQYLYFSSDRGGSMNLWRVRLEETSGTLLSPLEPVTTPSSRSGFMSLSRDGRQLAYVQQSMSFNLYKVAFDPSREAVVGQPVPITRSSREMMEPDPSPDDQWLTFRTSGKQEDVFVVRTDGTGLRQLTDDVHNDRRPRWSPDGKRIAFYSNRAGSHQVWAIHPDGSGLEQLTYEPRGDVLNPVWSPDGARLAYSIMGVNSFLMKLGRPWGDQSPEAWPGPSGPDTYVVADSWSTDGRKLAGTVHRPDGPAGIAVYPFERHELERLTDWGTWARWLRDGRRLLFADSGKLYLADSRSKKVHEVLSVAPHEVYGYGVPSRDERWIYFTLLATEADVWLATDK